MADFDPVAMDKAATEAEVELSEALTEEPLCQGVDWMIDWWFRWYMTAGHKRLGRTLVQYAKERQKEMEG